MCREHREVKAARVIAEAKATVRHCVCEERQSATGRVTAQDVLLRTSPAMVTILCTVPRCADRAGWEAVRCSTITSICLTAATQRGTFALIKAFTFPTPSTISYGFFSLVVPVSFIPAGIKITRLLGLVHSQGSLLACQGCISSRLDAALSKCQEG